MSWEAIIITLTSDIGSKGDNYFPKAFAFVMPKFMITAVVAVVIFVLVKKYVSKKKEGKRRFIKWGFLAGAVIFLIGDLLFFKLLFFPGKNEIATEPEVAAFMNAYYMDPQSVSINASGKTKNIIWLYIEGMECSYADRADGGYQEGVNYIPELTRLANENISFSQDDGFGGLYAVRGGDFTLAGIFDSRTGYSYSYALKREGHDKSNYHQELVTLDDILAGNGYEVEFMFGSDAEFVGKKEFLEYHGCKVFDYNTMIEQRFIPEDYYVWWGVEDAKLYECAKAECLRLAASGKPFSFSLLTADTHSEGGYVCDQCGDEYSEQMGNVIACTDRQAAEFVSWIGEQDFAADTVIMIMGDHLSMDAGLLENVGNEERFVYNCLINADTPENYREKNRIATHYDIFPTVLSAMGFEIEDDRLGVGTNLFSDKETLGESLGMDVLNKYLKMPTSRGTGN
ncbi:MAG: LTA synthase family protein [Lachnospiraceae bacterium]|nr:LTA synthase family protein [Lachnospiraceae bacterium]